MRTLKLTARMTADDQSDPPVINRFARTFELDRYQLQAREAIHRDENVLVSAPTGSGKTVVAELAVERAIESHQRCFYTAPIKALSNQKYNDLRREIGADHVGLMTGDHSINVDAPVVVMTTEVLRNMAYADASSMDDLAWVVLDEVHFLSDTYRGPVWEEVLIHTPAHVHFVCLSATVSNAVDLGEWIAQLRGPTTTIIEHERPVELESLMMVGDRTSGDIDLVPLLRGGKPNPEGKYLNQERSPSNARGKRGRSRFYAPRRPEVIRRLSAEGLLPAIYFIFSRQGCDDAARRCLENGLRLTTKGERQRINTIIDAHLEDLSGPDREILGVASWRQTLENGIAAHHAGMIPAFREAVEACFVEGLLKTVFATETLALGINMPARSVVIETLSKFNGESHEPIGAGTFTQLTGRAGRRGIDDHGDAVVLWSPFTTFEQVANLAASRDFPLESAFRPNYNMAANLIENYSRSDAFSILEQSFAEFSRQHQMTESLGELDRVTAELSETEHAVERDSTAQVFDVAGYVDLLGRAEDERQARSSLRVQINRYLAGLRPGDVLALDISPECRSDSAAGGETCVVLSVAQRHRGRVLVKALDSLGNRISVDSNSDWASSVVIDSIDLPVPYLPKDPGFQAEAAKALSRRNPRRPNTVSGRFRLQHRGPVLPYGDTSRQMEEHPLHLHPDRDRLVAELSELNALKERVAKLRVEVAGQGGSLEKQFEATLDVLERTGHVDQWNLTPAGRRLRHIFHQSDLLISIAVSGGIFDDLDPAELAAMVSCYTYEHRGREEPGEPVVPTLRLRDRLRDARRSWRQLNRLERSSGLTLTNEPDGGLMSSAWAWASGNELALVIDEDLTGGDFVRNMRQVMDLAGQIAKAVEDPDTASVAKAAAAAIRRGVVATSGIAT